MSASAIASPALSAEDIDAELAAYAAPERPRVATPAAPSPVRHVGEALLDIDRAAMTMAYRFNAVDAEGRLWCILCPPDHPRPGQLPHLCCGYHIGEWRRQRREGRR